MFNNREKEYLELIDTYKKKIESLSEELSASKKKITVIRQPGDSDAKEYCRAISNLTQSEFYLFYFDSLRRDITDKFSVSSGPADFFRGQLALIGKIFEDSRFAYKDFNTMDR